MTFLTELVQKFNETSLKKNLPLGKNIVLKLPTFLNHACAKCHQMRQQVYSVGVIRGYNSFFKKKCALRSCSVRSFCQDFLMSLFVCLFVCLVVLFHHPLPAGVKHVNIWINLQLVTLTARHFKQVFQKDHFCGWVLYLFIFKCVNPFHGAFISMINYIYFPENVRNFWFWFVQAAGSCEGHDHHPNCEALSQHI